MHAAVSPFFKRTRSLACKPWCALFALCLGCATGCPSNDSKPASSGSAGTSGGAAGNSGEPAAKFTDIYTMLFPRTTNAHCDMCHGLPAFDQSNGNLYTGMDRASTYAALVNKKSTSSMCQGMSLVEPGKPEMSLLYVKVKPNPPCGIRMPNGGMPLSDAQIEMIRSWIAAGAKDD